MKLDELIKQTALDVVKAVIAVQNEVSSVEGADIPPTRINIDFDIGLEVIEESKLGGELKVTTFLASGGGGESSSQKHSSTHRVKLSIPVSLPESQKRSSKENANDSFIRNHNNNPYPVA